MTKRLVFILIIAAFIGRSIAQSPLSTANISASSDAKGARFRDGGIEEIYSTWVDVDFEAKTIEICPKKDTKQTWEWHVKNTSCRTLPPAEEIVRVLVQHQGKLPEGYPYVFVPPLRYDFIQRLRKQGKWSLCDSRLKVINNFNRHSKMTLKPAGVKKGQFHDLRRTALSNWFANEMSEHGVKTLASRSSFATTHEFYPAVAEDLVDRARQATAQSIGGIYCRCFSTSEKD